MISVHRAERLFHWQVRGDAIASALQALQIVQGGKRLCPDPDLQRAFVQSLLTEQFDRRLINDARFQQVVDRVTDALGEDEGTSRLLGRMMDELRASAR